MNQYKKAQWKLPIDQSLSPSATDQYKKLPSQLLHPHILHGPNVPHNSRTPSKHITPTPREVTTTYATHIYKLRDELSNLFYPTSCPCCGAQDVTLCQDCLLSLTEHPHKRNVDGFQVISCGDYTPQARAFIAAYKVMKRITLAKFMGMMLAPQLKVFSETHGSYSVITIPSTRRSWRSRGFHPVNQALKTTGVKPFDLLYFRRQPKDQAFLNRAQRMENMFGTLHARPPPDYVRNLLFVDDVMTSAATLLEVHRAVSLLNVKLIGAVVLFAKHKTIPSNPT